MKKTLKPLAFIFAFASIFNLLSCDNFLNGSELKEQVEQEILIANSSRSEIVSVEPKLTSGGVYLDSNIVVNFSKKMDSKYFSDFSYISITDSNGNNLTEHYLTPVLSQDGLVLTISHNSSNYISVEEGTTKTVKVTLSKNISDTETIPLKNSYSWSFSINDKRDDKAPEFLSGTTVKGNSESEMAEGTFATLINNLGADAFFTETYHCNSVNLNVRSNDTGSGVAKLIVKEKLLYGVDGIDVKDKNFFVETVYKNIIKDGENYFFTGKHELTKNIADGIIELTLTVEDKCGNKNSKTFALVKDTEVTANYENVFGDDANPYVSKTESNNYFEIKNVTSKPWATWNNKVYYDNISFKKIELLDSDKNFIESGNKLDENRLYYKFDSISNDYCYYINVICFDDSGNTASNFVHLNSAPAIVSFWEASWINSYSIWLNDTNESESAEIIAYYKADSEYQALNYDSKTKDIYIPNNTTSVYFRIKYYSSYEFGLYSNEITKFKVNPNFKTISKEMFTCTITPCSDINKGYQLKVIINNDEFLKLQNKAVKVSAPINIDFAKSFPCTEKELTINLSNEDIRSLFMTTYPSPYENEEKKVCIGLQAFDPAGYTSSSFKGINGNYDIMWYKDTEWQAISLQSVTNYSTQDTDLYSPVISIPNSIFSPDVENNNSISVSLIANDLPNLTDAFLTKDGKLPVKLYYTNKSSTYNLSKNEIQLLDCIETELYITEIASDKKQVRGYVSLNKVYEELNKTNDKEFDCYVWVEDRSGNVSWKKITYLYLGAEFNVVYDSENFLDKFSVTQNESATYEMKMIPIGRTIPDGHAGYPYHVMNNNLKISEDNENVKSSLYNGDDKISPTFVELNVSHSAKLLTGINYQKDWYVNRGYSYYVYTHKTTCNLKNIFENNDKLTIFNDKPVLVHTVCCPVDFGKDIHSWEAWSQNGYKLNEKIIDPATTGMNFNNYEYPSKNDIPSGWYYAAIIYFADNTSTIGTVFKN